MKEEVLISRALGSAVDYKLPLEQRYYDTVTGFLSFVNAVEQSYRRMIYYLTAWVILACIATNCEYISFNSLLFNVALVIISWVFLYILRSYSIGTSAVKYYYQQGVLGRDHIIKQLIDKYELTDNPNAQDQAYKQAMEYNNEMTQKVLQYHNEHK